MIGFTINYQPRAGRLVDSVEITLSLYDRSQLGYACGVCGSRRSDREHLLILRTGEPERRVIRCTNTEACRRRRLP